MVKQYADNTRNPKPTVNPSVFFIQIIFHFLDCGTMWNASLAHLCSSTSRPPSVVYFQVLSIQTYNRYVPCDGSVKHLHLGSSKIN